MLRCLEKDPEGRATLVELARTLAKYAPDRAKASLERIEATAGTAETRPRAMTYADRGRAEPTGTRSRLGDSVTTGGRSGRTISSWGRDRRGKRSGNGLVVLLVVASGLAAVAVYTGRIGVMKLRGDLGGAASAMSSAAGAVSSAVSAEASAVASSLPPIPPLPPLLPSDEPAASASGSSSSEAEEPEPGSEEPAASASGSAGPTPQGHPGAQKGHGKATHKGKHKHHV